MRNLINPCLWFDGNVHEAAQIYADCFKECDIREQSPMVLTMKVAGQEFTLLNGGPETSRNSSVSFYCICESPGEVDQICKQLAKEGTILMEPGKYDWSNYYTWIEDKFGVSWQISEGSLEDARQKITPCLLFVGEQFGKGEEAIRSYISIFKNSGISTLFRYDQSEPGMEGAIRHASFYLDNYQFMLMESSHDYGFSFTEAVSFVITCKSQKEIDYYWENLSYGGNVYCCGWIKDRFGVSWQVIPEIIGKLLKDPSKAGRVSEAFLKMEKFDIEELKQL
jgi:predicted 3-demethylubiquinone-9 3-methyltransferase (glyoxalase superfamily)